MNTDTHGSETADVVQLIIQGPGRNALGEELMAGIITQARAAAGRPLLVTGGGTTFSAGLNLKEVVALDQKGMKHFLGLLDEMVDALYTYPGPMIACVNGHAIAGGCIIALCCDLRIIADECCAPTAVGDSWWPDRRYRRRPRTRS